MSRNTVVHVENDQFFINGSPTYPGRSYQGHRVEGLLINARLIQGVFDDRNPETRPLWDYPDGPWDPDRNAREFIQAMPVWHAHGLAAFTVNFQGGSPQGYSKEQPWHNSAYEADGTLRDDYADRMATICDRADELGMAVILGMFYFGQDQRLQDEAAVVRACDNAADWVLGRGYTHVLIEIANEADVGRYDYDILRGDRGEELIDRVQDRSAGKVDNPAGRLLVSTSMKGGSIPPAAVVEAGDFVLLHGNGVEDPDRIEQMVDIVRDMDAYRGEPIVFNEDDHFDFDKPNNNMLAAIRKYAGWGYFDYRLPGEGFDEGYQSVPTNWGISSSRKKGFFDLLAKITGAK
jgi:hypothetical protein